MFRSNNSRNEDRENIDVALLLVEVDRLRAKCEKQSQEIKRLRNAKYSKGRKIESLQEIISALKEEHLISSNEENDLKVYHDISSPIDTE